MSTTKSDLDKFKQFVKNTRYRAYMSGVEREKSRVKSTGEVFTPTALVQEILNNLPNEVFEQREKTFLDPTCGDGQFLSEVVIRKIKQLIRQGNTFNNAHSQALKTVYGVDLMKDNCIETIKRLHMVTDKDIVCVSKSDMPALYKSAPGIKYIFKLKGAGKGQYLNIVCADALTYDFSFGEEQTFGNGLFSFED